jgi:CheY-like chemotaxis protein
LAGLQILFVQDNPDECALVRCYLGLAGADVVAVRSAAEALTILDVAPVDVLISDVSLPEHDGYELVSSVRGKDIERGRYVPAIAATAWGGDESRAAALAAGFDAFLLKPYGPDVLVHTVRDIAGFVRQQQAVRAFYSARGIEQREIRERLMRRQIALERQRARCLARMLKEPLNSTD